LTEAGLFWLADEYIPTPVITILAGTQFNGLILKSIDGGDTFTNEGSAGLGNPTVFCQALNGDILYGTDTGYVVNYTQGTSVSVSANPILSLVSFAPTNIAAGTIDDFSYSSNDNGQTFFSADNVNSGAINAIIIHEGMPYYFTAGGIIRGNGTLIQAGSFTVGLDAGGDVFYTGDTLEHIWKSIDHGDTWVDLGEFDYNDSPSCMIRGNNNRLLYSSGPQITYSDDGFSSYSESSPTAGDTIQILHVTGDILLIADDIALINKSIDNGVTWTAIAGNPQQGEDAINCLIKY
jgi:hypothetical protein